MKPKPCIKEEIEALSYNLDIVVEKLHSGTLSAAGTAAAEELAKTLKKLKEFITLAKSDDSKVYAIMMKLPLLYFQIPKLN